MNLAQLRTAVAGYAHRTDLATLFPTFVELAEQRIYTGETNTPKVRVAAMQQFVQLADGTRPAGFLEAVRITEADSPDKRLDYCPMAALGHARNAYSWDGETLVLSSDQGFPVDVTYYARFTTPVADDDTNWLLTNHSRVYLTAVLVEVGVWSMDDAMAAREASNYASAVTALNSSDKAAQISGSVLKVRR